MRGNYVLARLDPPMHHTARRVQYLGTVMLWAKSLGSMLSTWQVGELLRLICLTWNRMGGSLRARNPFCVREGMTRVSRPQSIGANKWQGLLLGYTTMNRVKLYSKICPRRTNSLIFLMGWTIVHWQSYTKPNPRIWLRLYLSLIVWWTSD